MIVQCHVGRSARTDDNKPLLLLWKYCSTETVGLLGTGARDVQLDFLDAAPELCDNESEKWDYLCC